MRTALLPKSEIQKQKSLERKREIDEGIKLSRRVDGLRELAASTEANVEKYKVESLKQAQKEIAEALQKRDVLLTEIAERKNELAVLRIPLDAEWQRLHQEQMVVEEIKERNANRVQVLQKQTIALERKEQSLRTLERDIENQRTNVNTANTLAVRKNTEADAFLEEARNRRLDAEQWADAKERELLHRELEVAGRERDAKNLEKSNTKRQKELDAWEKNLSARYEQLARTAQRIKNKTL